MGFFRVFSLFVVLLCSAFVGLSCNHIDTNLQDTSIDAQETAKANFTRGEEALGKKRFNEAIKYFDVVRNQFPYSKYAATAELKSADAFFAKEKWIESADAYALFVRFHPTHEQAPYASFRSALAYFEEIDEAWPLLPPPYEKDQGPASDAVRAFDDFLQRFPADPNAKRALELRTIARGKLAETDWYVARFYLEREHWQGAVFRYLRIAREYGDTVGAGNALLLAADTLEQHLHRPEEAKRLREEHQTRFVTAKKGTKA